MASNSSSTSTLLDSLGRNKVQIGFEVFFAVVICLVSILGNSLVVVVAITDPQLKNITNVFIHNLAWTDICMAALVMPFWIFTLYNGRWIFNTEICQWTATMMFTCGNASIWTMALIAVNRYLKVVKPNIYPKFFPGIRMARVYCVCVWLLAVLLSTPPLYGWGQFAYNQNPAACGLVWEIENISYAVVVVGTNFCGIFSVILFCYYKIYQTLKVSSTTLGSHRAENAVQLSQITDMKLLKAIFTIVCLFAVCWVPATAGFMCEVIFGPPPRVVTISTIYVMFCSSGVNPVIFGVMNSQLQRAFKNVLRCKKSHQESQMSQIVGARGWCTNLE